MKVILLENMRKVGSIEECRCKRGYTRNFLISQKLLAKENIKEVEKIKNDLSKKTEEKSG